MKIKFKIEKTNNDHSAYSIQYPIFTTSTTLELDELFNNKLFNNINDAISLYFNQEYIIENIQFNDNINDNNSQKYELKIIFNKFKKKI